jgi:hypothetical protein
MARKLEVFQTSLGFYDLAIAAPSMKAALEALIAISSIRASNESDDPEVVAATLSKPRRHSQALCRIRWALQGNRRARKGVNTKASNAAG